MFKRRGQDYPAVWKSLRFLQDIRHHEYRYESVGIRLLASEDEVVFTVRQKDGAVRAIRNRAVRNEVFERSDRIVESYHL